MNDIFGEIYLQLEDTATAHNFAHVCKMFAEIARNKIDRMKDRFALRLVHQDLEPIETVTDTDVEDRFCTILPNGTFHGPSKLYYAQTLYSMKCVTVTYNNGKYVGDLIIRNIWNRKPDHYEVICYNQKGESTGYRRWTRALPANEGYISHNTFVSPLLRIECQTTWKTNIEENREFVSIVYKSRVEHNYQSITKLTVDDYKQNLHISFDHQLSPLRILTSIDNKMFIGMYAVNQDVKGIASLTLIYRLSVKSYSSVYVCGTIMYSRGEPKKFSGKLYFLYSPNSLWTLERATQYIKTKDYYFLDITLVELGLFAQGELIKAYGAHVQDNIPSMYNMTDFV